MKQYQILARRKQVFDYVILGMSDKQIMDKLNVPLSTLSRDKLEIRKEISKEAHDKGVDGFYADLQHSYKMRTKEFWRIILDPKTHKREKLSALHGLREEDKEFRKLCQAVGFLPKTIDSLITANEVENLSITQNENKDIKLIWGEIPKDKKVENENTKVT